MKKSSKRPFTARRSTARKPNTCWNGANNCGGFVPQRKVRAKPLRVPEAVDYEEFFKGSGDHSMSTTMATVRILTKLLASRGDRQTHRPDHSRRSENFRHGFAVPPDRYLLSQRTTLRARRSRDVALLQRSQRRPDSRRRHYRGRRHVVVHRRGHGLRASRHQHDPILLLLLHVRFPAHRRFNLGGGGQQGKRLFVRRDSGTNDAQRRRAYSIKTATATCWRAPFRLC